MVDRKGVNSSTQEEGEDSYSDPEEYPHPNQLSKRRDYWDYRFSTEDTYEWLVSYE